MVLIYLSWIKFIIFVKYFVNYYIVYKNACFLGIAKYIIWKLYDLFVYETTKTIFYIG